MQNNTLSRADLNYESGTVKNVHYGDVLIKFGDYIDASKIDLPYISDDTKADKFKSSFLQDGDIIIADTAEDDTVGKCTEIQGSEGLRLLSGLHTIACRPKEKYGPMFLGYYINSPAYHNQLKPLMQGIKVTSISKSALQNTDMAIPKSIDEQITIGKCFSYIDNLITLHQRKYDKLVNVKKAMLEKMFSKDGADVPEIRFKGFTEAWEQRKLGEIVGITMGQSPDGATYSETQADYILIQGNADLKDGWVYPRVWTTQKTKTAEAGDLIMSVRAPAGTMGKTSYNAVIGRGVASIKGNEFIFQTLNKMDADGYWRRLSAGSTFESLNSDSIKNAEIMVPTTQEQVQIGNIFQNLDNLITLHQRKLLNLV